MKIAKLIKKNSPTIFVVAGIAGIIVATVKACQASRHVDEILDEHAADIEEIKDGKK